MRKHRLVGVVILSAFANMGRSLLARNLLGPAWRTEIARSEVGRPTKIPLENRGRFPFPTFFQAIDISALLPTSPGHQKILHKRRILLVFSLGGTNHWVSPRRALGSKLSFARNVVRITSANRHFMASSWRSEKCPSWEVIDVHIFGCRTAGKPVARPARSLTHEN